MVYVGYFNERQLDAKEDEAAVREAMKKTGLQYVKTQLHKSKGDIVAIEIWLCSREEYYGI